MILDKDFNRGITGKAVSLEPGALFVTQMQGKKPEVVKVDVVSGSAVGLTNIETGKPFSGAVEKIARGRLGRSTIVEAAVRKPVTVENSDPFFGIGTDMVVVSPKGAKEEILTIVSGMEAGDVLLALPEKPDKQFVRVPQEELLEGSSEHLYFKPVPLKFGLLRRSEELTQALAVKRRTDNKAEKVVVSDPEGIASRDIDTAIAVADSMPNISSEDRLNNPDGVFQQGVAIAVSRLIENGEAKAVAAALALYGGNLMHARLSVMRD